MKKDKDSLSKTEWTIMNICWKKGKSSARVIYDESLKKKERGYETIKVSPIYPKEIIRAIKRLLTARTIKNSTALI